MRLSLISILLITFSACTTGVKMKSINFGPLFHDGNSKVWMLEKVITGDKNYAPMERADKDIIIFYESGKCNFQPLKTLGDIPGKKGQYSLFSDEKNLTIYFKNEKWDFIITTLSENKIILKPTNKSDLNYTLELIPLPEL